MSPEPKYQLRSFEKTRIKKYLNASFDAILRQTHYKSQKIKHLQVNHSQKQKMNLPQKAAFCSLGKKS